MENNDEQLKADQMMQWLLNAHLHRVKAMSVTYDVLLTNPLVKTGQHIERIGKLMKEVEQVLQYQLDDLDHKYGNKQEAGNE